MSNLDHGIHFHPGRQRCAAIQLLDLDDEVDHRLLGMELLHQTGGCGDRAAGGEEVVVDEDHVVGRDRIAVDLNRVVAVFLFVGPMMVFIVVS